VRSRLANRKWRLVATADLKEYPPWQNTPQLRWEADTWREYQLALIMPMRFPEHADDADISATLRYVAKTETLPWLIPDECLKWTDQ
jgi:hypothetical protein